MFERVIIDYNDNGFGDILIIYNQLYLIINFPKTSYRLL